MARTLCTVSEFLEYKQDVFAHHQVEILISASGKRIWINVDGRCYLRVMIMEEGVIELHDERITKDSDHGGQT